MNIEEIRSQFPQLKERVYGKSLVYLDNAATSLRPVSVVEKWDEISLKYNSNLHRAVHHTAVVATEEYESARESVRDFIGAESSDEIVFTSGTTHSLNLLAACLGNSLKEGDEIIISESEHHSNIVPWQLLSERKNLNIKVLPIDDNGNLRVDILPSLLTEKTRICCVAQISNVLGIINPVGEIIRLCHANGTLVVLDGAQGIVHETTNVRDIDCDFYVFSAHKMYGASGVGVLYGKRNLLENMPPFMGGGEMIESVSWTHTTYAPIPRRFEAGTQNISGVPAIKPAIEMVKMLRDKEIQDNYNALGAYVYTELSREEGVRLFGTPSDPSQKIPLFSIAVEGAHHEDLALILDKMGIATRSGRMCADPLMDRLGVSGMLRASFAPYNTMEEAEYFITCLRKAIKMLR